MLTLDPEDIWNVWPTNMTSDYFLNTYASTALDGIITSYMNVLRNSINALEADLETLQSNYVSTLTLLKDSLDAYTHSLLVDENFIRYVAIIC